MAARAFKSVRLLWEERVQIYRELLAKIEALPEFENPKWRAGMMRHYQTELDRLLSQEPPQV